MTSATKTRNASCPDVLFVKKARLFSLPLSKFSTASALHIDLSSREL